MAKELDPKNPNVFVWEFVLEKRGEGGDVEYLIKWKGYPHEDNTWELASNLPQEVIDFYENEVAPLVSRRNSWQPSTSTSVGTNNGRSNSSGQDRSSGQPASTVPQIDPDEFNEDYMGQVGGIPILRPRQGNPFCRIMYYIPETKGVEKVLYPQNPQRIKELHLSYLVVMKDYFTGEFCAGFIHHQILKIAYPHLIIECLEKKIKFSREEFSKTDEELRKLAMKALHDPWTTRYKVKEYKKPKHERVPLLEDTPTESDSSDESDDSETRYEKIDLQEYLRNRLNEVNTDSESD